MATGVVIQSSIRTPGIIVTGTVTVGGVPSDYTVAEGRYADFAAFAAALETALDAGIPARAPWTVAVRSGYGVNGFRVTSNAGAAYLFAMTDARLRAYSGLPSGPVADDGSGNVDSTATPAYGLWTGLPFMFQSLF